jgi:hypothetical protein
MFAKPALAVLLATASVGLHAQQPPQSREVTGAWVITLTLELGTARPELTLTQKGDLITGTYKGRYGEFPITGRVRGGTIHFEFKMRSAEEPAEMCFDGEVSADAACMKGTADMADLGRATWTASRAKADAK